MALTAALAAHQPRVLSHWGCRHVAALPAVPPFTAYPGPSHPPPRTYPTGFARQVVVAWHGDRQRRRRSLADPSRTDRASAAVYKNPPVPVQGKMPIRSELWRFPPVSKQTAPTCPTPYLPLRPDPASHTLPLATQASKPCTTPSRPCSRGAASSRGFPARRAPTRTQRACWASATMPTPSRHRTSSRSTRSTTAAGT